MVTRFLAILRHLFVRRYQALLYLFRPPLIQKTEWHTRFDLPGLELEIPPARGLYKRLPLKSECLPGDFTRQEVRLTWTIPARLSAWLHSRLEEQSNILVSRALFSALNRNRLAPAPLIQNEPATGYLERLICLRLEFPHAESLYPALPAPFLTDGTEIHIFIYKSSETIHLEILVPARIVLGSNMLSGFFQLEDLSLEQPAIWSSRGGSYRLRPEGIRLACVEDTERTFAIAFRPDRPLEAGDRLSEVLRAPSLLFRLNRKFELEWYEQDFQIILNQIQIADICQDNGFSDYLRGRLLTDWEDAAAFSLPGARLVRTLGRRAALSRTSFQFPLARENRSLTPSHVHGL